MFRQTLGIQTLPRTRGISTGIGHLKNWKKSGSVNDVYAYGRHCIKLENKKTLAKVLYSLGMPKGIKSKVSADIFSPCDNQGTGTGVVVGSMVNWSPVSGMWKSLEASIGEDGGLSIECRGRRQDKITGDVCFVDLRSVKIETNN